MAPTDEKAMTTKTRWSKKKLRYHYCHELGHFKQDCPKLVERSETGANDSSDGDAMVVSQLVFVSASAS